MTDGPLDLTVPLNIAEVRAALATGGPLRRVGLAAYVAASKSASAGSARPQEGQDGGHRRTGTRYPAGKPKRLGRIFAFVAVAAGLSIGTAYALVLSNSAQNISISLPATGAIPVARNSSGRQHGQAAVDSGSTSAQAAPSLSRSPAPALPVAVVTTRRATPTSSATATATGSAGTGPTATASPGGSASAVGPTISASVGFGPTPTIGVGAQWAVLYEGEDENSQTVQETSDVQSLLQTLGYLQTWRHGTYIAPGYSVSADPTGYYGSATTVAIAEFQQDCSVDYTDQVGVTDASTYQALVEAVEQAGCE